MGENVRNLRDGSDQPEIGDITGEAELAVVLRNVFRQSSVLKPRSTLAKISSGCGPGDFLAVYQ